jgi:antirestriction protein ArdC
MTMDIYAEVTNKIVTQLAQGVRPWQQSWATSGRSAFPVMLRANGEAYTGINVLLLWSAYQEKGYAQRRWMTYKQAQTLGAQVRKGEKSTMIVYASSFKKTVEDAKGDEKEKNISFLKSYLVFNIEQIDGLPGHLFETFKAPTAKETKKRIAAAEAFMNDVGATVKFGGDSAYFNYMSDHVGMPNFEAFKTSEDYYATFGHELVHWTGHKSRLDRTFGTSGTDEYAREELIAELGAAFLCAHLGIAAEPREDHASYLKHWLKVLKDDKRAIFKAASMAQKAVDDLRKRVEGEAVETMEVVVKQPRKKVQPQAMAA